MGNVDARGYMEMEATATYGDTGGRKATGKQGNGAPRDMMVVDNENARELTAMYCLLHFLLTKKLVINDYDYQRN